MAFREFSDADDNGFHDGVETSADNELDLSESAEAAEQLEREGLGEDVEATDLQPDEQIPPEEIDTPDNPLTNPEQASEEQAQDTQTTTEAETTQELAGRSAEASFASGTEVEETPDDIPLDDMEQSDVMDLETSTSSEEPMHDPETDAAPEPPNNTEVEQSHQADELADAPENLEDKPFEDTSVSDSAEQHDPEDSNPPVEATPDDDREMIESSPADQMDTVQEQAPEVAENQHDSSLKAQEQPNESTLETNVPDAHQEPEAHSEATTDNAMDNNREAKEMEQPAEVSHVEPSSQEDAPIERDTGDTNVVGASDQARLHGQGEHHDTEERTAAPVEHEVAKQDAAAEEPVLQESEGNNCVPADKVDASVEVWSERASSDGPQDSDTLSLSDKAVRTDDSIDTRAIKDNPDSSGPHDRPPDKPPEGSALESELNSPFSRENFRAENSYDTRANIEHPTLNELKSRCVYDVSPMGTPDSEIDRSNKDVYTAGEVQSLKDVRNSIDAPDEDTIMQKVIGVGTGDLYKDLDKYLNPRDFSGNACEAHVMGCVAKAEDAAPFTTTPQECFDNLRLDYPRTDYQDPNQSVYVIRFTNGTNYDIPYSTEFGGGKAYPAPMTGNGFTGSEQHVIPENTVVPENNKGAIVTDGEIYRVNPDGSEELVARHNNRDRCFELVDKEA